LDVTWKDTNFLSERTKEIGDGTDNLYVAVQNNQAFNHKNTALCNYVIRCYITFVVSTLRITAIKKARDNISKAYCHLDFLQPHDY